MSGAYSNSTLTLTPYDSNRPCGCARARPSVRSQSGSLSSLGVVGIVPEPPGGVLSCHDQAQAKFLTFRCVLWPGPSISAEAPQRHTKSVNALATCDSRDARRHSECSMGAPCVGFCAS